jgi:hypothetical protein
VAQTCFRCDKKISFAGSFTDSRYCCKEHRKKDREEMTELAIQRLRNTPAFHRPERPAVPEATGVKSALPIVEPA